MIISSIMDQTDVLRLLAANVHLGANKINSQQELSPQSQTSQKSLSSALKNTVKELFTNSANTPDVLPTHHQDGFQEH